MRRQSEPGGAAAMGSGRALRLDPSALPIRFTATDAGADHRVRLVELHRERVVLRRAVHGMRMAVNVPISAFLGVAVRLSPGGGDAPHRVSVSLEHRDPALCVPLYAAGHGEDIVAEWQLWARVFGLPLLVSDISGNLREPFRRIGAVRLEDAAPRRRRRNAVKARRPSILLRRRPGVPREVAVIHREREIIARD